MRKKAVLTETVKSRHRRTQLEMLGDPSRDQRRLIKDIAQSADLPIQRVFRDVISAGLSVFTSPETSPYKSMIEFREELAKREAAFYGVEESTVSDGEPIRPGSSGQHAGNGAIASETHESPDSVFPGDALERPGLSAPDEERDHIPVEWPPKWESGLVPLPEASPSDDDEALL